MQNHVLVSFVIFTVVALQLTVSEHINGNIERNESFEIPSDNSNCGRLKIKFKPLITIPLPTFHGEFPWHAAIFKSDGPGNRKYICGGSLLNDNTVLTTAKCVSHKTGIIEPTLLIVALGKFDLDTAAIENRESRINRVIPHEQFNQNDYENNIAILKLQTTIEFSSFIQPICITNDPGIFESKVGVAAGWGAIEFNTAETILKKASLLIRTNDECRKNNPDILSELLHENNFCAGYQNGTSVCSVDSGSGLIFQQDDQWYLRGVVSWLIFLPGLDQCDATKLVLFTDVVKYFDWITNKL